MTRLREHRARQKAAEATEFTKLARKLGLDPATAEDLTAAYLADTRNTWTFVMLSPAQNDAVVEWQDVVIRRQKRQLRQKENELVALRAKLAPLDEEFEGFDD